MTSIPAFIHLEKEDWEDDVGNSGRVFKLVNTKGDVEEVSYSVKQGEGRPYFWASEIFVTKYSEILPIGDVLSWNLKDEMYKWIASIIFHSFLQLEDDNAPVYWFVKNYDYATANCRTFMPQIPEEMVSDYAGETTWVLFRTGHKVWPVEIINNQLEDGWLSFWVDHHLQFGSKLIFGTQRKYIFDVIILDRDLKRNHYDWFVPYENHMSVPTSELSRVCTSWLPMVFSRESYIVEFGYIYGGGISIAQVFNDRLEAFLSNPDVTAIDFSFGNCIATVPRVNGRLHSPRFRVFANALGLQPQDLVYVAVYDPTDVRVIVFNSSGVERRYV